ncbi:iron-containing redox enzyme family protein [Actinomadura terrae]|uniref:iron-containing redox enzyme family protein n=1 Tax=Actinomadura terrae TaxID=604353 RepID=UPI001FA76302|nr:iron-containing redox enzyme family protein [Actinomadura terrae]
MATTDDVERGADQQAKSLLGSRLDWSDDVVVNLYSHYWPPVPAFSGLPDQLAEYLNTPRPERATMLARLRGAEAHERFLHESLAEIYAYLYKYRDGAATQESHDDIEIDLLTAKIELERELLNHWLGHLDLPDFPDQSSAADYLDEFAESNPGVGHPLFAYLADEAPRWQLDMFLRGETIRNEVVDDEVAMLVVGMQGAQKAVVAANLWDECGRGKLENFHTFWLRRLIEASDGGWAGFDRQRARNPWFAKITSNMNAMLLSRPAWKQMAYGCFLVFESWVEPHFRHLLRAMDRYGVEDPDVRIYFAAHVAVDPRHSRELSDGLRFQRPTLSSREVAGIVRGAHMAAEAGRRQYDKWLTYFQQAADPHDLGSSGSDTGLAERPSRGSLGAD